MRLSPAAAAVLIGLLAAGAGRPQSAGDGYLEQVAAGLARAEQGHFDIALKEFAAAAPLDPDDGLAYLGQALCHLANGRLDEAAALFRCADGTDRADAVAQLGLGVCHFEAGALQQAAACLAGAAQLDPGLASPHLYLALIALCDGRLDESRDEARRAADLGAPAVVLDYVEALRLLAAGRWEAAAASLKRLRPKVATVVPGLPLTLPLQIIEESDGRVRVGVPSRGPLSERIATRALPPTPELAQPEWVGDLLIEAPLPGETVSGRLPVRIRLRQAHLFQYVAVHIDGKLRGMTNRPPYYVVWDTSLYPDGPHVVTAKAIGDAPIEASVTVTVQNQRATVRSQHDPALYRSYARRLAALLTHGLPPVSVEKLLMQAYRQQDPELALELCERVLAKDPQRADVVPELLALYRQQGLVIDVARIPEPHRGVAGAMRVALTFDDGPRPEFTPPILDLLARARARATFLVTGRMCERHPDLVRAIADAGHEVASHTYNHLRLDTLTPDQVVFELVKTKVVLDDLIGGSARFFRPPGGHYNARIREIVAALGYFPVFWTINGGDFQALSGPDGAEAIMKRISDGAIVLLHNGPDNTLRVLPYLLDRLQREGYRMVTVSDLLRPPADLAVTERATFGPLAPERIEAYAGTE